MTDNSDWRYKVFHGDSKGLIKRIPDNSVDFILTDPPYNLAQHSTGNIPLQGRSAINNDVAKWDEKDFNPEEWVDEFIRILKPTGNLFIFTSYNQIGRWYACLDHRFDTSNFMIWHKTNPVPKIYKAGFLNSCEMIFTCWNKKHTWNFTKQNEMHNFLESPICMGPERLKNPKHPAQKPVSILKRIVEIASNPNDIIFDPFMGVGSTGVAAMALNRRFIGVEIEKDYFEASQQRIEQESRKPIEPSLLDYTESKMIQPQRKLNTPTLWDFNSPEMQTTYHRPTKEEKKAAIKEEKISKELSPILKWAGGKEKELKYIIPNAPQVFQNFYEPFVGGGSVFTGMLAKNYFINDFSEELISLYRNIATQDSRFFQYTRQIDLAWENAGKFFQENNEFVSLYQEFRTNTITEKELKRNIELQCGRLHNDILSILGDSFGMHQDVLTKEMNINLSRKMIRMKKLEQERHELPEKDLYDNVETAIRSAIYMYFRYLYNNKEIQKNNPTLHCALFLFIRNYCYSGMFRYNADGDFNVPYGGIAYNSKTMAKKLDYYQSSPLIQRFAKTQIYNLDFEAFLREVQPKADDFVFLDPPYDSEFSTYAQNEFTRADQERLANYMINECKAKWMLIIKHTDFIYNLYNKPGINIRTFDKEYLVCFMNRNDKKVIHLLITNY